ncbi:putative pyridoxamine 5-phosphate oxidase, FMN-binding (plasmid) [Crocosphaera subtropica ATCC 51142]|uniref:Pyridoxamine 5-phosphate oxidase, FMN-binding n=1 Tax=Crocosphaera subtropica (strain ATCC 51142 / BH68) TaxID=43989 RepID=B1X3A8_CROS5|nr:pyridoxamine 5'-phosphate oxidase family protein [Crocosphaera subtropica]ACB54619.1 putative pyridoxamine 5-phosphate oxidase, FMN-binding [Crocosphaera subtropica ATCC 51142]
MAKQFTNIAFTEGVKQAQTDYGSREIYQKFEQRGISEDVLSAREIEFIGARDSFYMGTVNSNNYPYIQFRGGPVGFLKVLHEKTLGFVDFVGNLQYLSVGNLRENDRVFLFLMDYAHRRRLKIWGRAQVIDDNPELLEALSDPNYQAQKARVFLIKVEAFDWNCPQHIPIRYSEAEVAQMTEPFLARIQELEKQVAQLQTSHQS